MVPPIQLTATEQIITDQACDFVGFGETVLGKRFHPIQKDVLNALFRAGSNVSFASCNDGGKTREVIATAVLASLFLFPKGRIMSTSGSFRQIKDQLNPELHKYAGLFPNWQFQDCRINTRHPNGFWHGFSTNEAGKFEGQHAGGRDEPLLLIYDEAKTIKDPVFQAGERCRTTRKLYASSTGFAQGEFYASQTIRKGFFQCFRQRADQCPHIPAERIVQMRLKWGPEHPLVKSALDAEFMGFVQGAIIQLADLDFNLANPPIYEPGERKLFCDFAWSESASGDSNVGALRDGNRITIPIAFRDRGIHAVAGRWVRHFNELQRSMGLQEWEIEGDADGEGATIIKLLGEMGWHIASSHNGGPPRFFPNYANLAAETWCEGGHAISKCKFILPASTEFYGQALNRRIVPSNRGLLAVESKQAMKDPNREGGAVSESPDYADGVFGCMSPLTMQRQKVLGVGTEPIPQSKNVFYEKGRSEEQELDQNRLPGAWFG